MKNKKFIKCPICDKKVSKIYVRGLLGLGEELTISMAPGVFDTIIREHTCFICGD